MSDIVRSAHILLLLYAEKTSRPFSEVAREYAILLRPTPTDLDGMIGYFESLARLQGDLATAYSGPPVSEGKENQTKLLILRYLSMRDCATSLDVSSNIHLSRTNSSERLKRYYKQGLLTRRALVTRRRGRRTMVYKLTEARQGRLVFLRKNVKFKRAETDASKKHRSYQKKVEMIVRVLRQRLAP
jgi:DNA-binding transcriptional ArsR family regulator